METKHDKKDYIIILKTIISDLLMEDINMSKESIKEKKEKIKCQMKEKAQEFIDDAKTKIQDKPLETVGIVLGVGILIGATITAIALAKE